MPTIFPNVAAEFVFYRTYSRWIEELKRREFYEETVDRYLNFIKSERDKIPPKVLRKIRERMLEFSVMPSMRALWSAGPAAKADNTTFYNCSFQVIDSVRSFSENLYILMCGTGYGFSVETKYVIDSVKLPEVPEICINSMTSGTFVIEDSKEGWADSIYQLMSSLYNGRDLNMDYSKLRPKGSRLKTMGGRSSGPEPLIMLHGFIREVFQNAQGRKLKPIECHDICNQIAEIVVVGGVRRSSEISLSDLNDEDMRMAKVGMYPVRRAMANNSAVYLEKPSAADFLKEWHVLVASGTGERGIFNLEGARKSSPKRRNSDLIDGVNPCGEILLRDSQFCNLSEVVVRPDDDLDELLDKVETATWIGVIQSTFTYFPYLSKKWKKNTEEERLLGVSLTGQCDNYDLLTPDALRAMKSRSIKVAKRASQKMGINMPAAITCIKPSGSVSQLVNSSSGLHPRYALYYIRRYRIASTDPLLRLLKDQGIKAVPENGQRRKDWNAAKNGERNRCTIYRPRQEWSEDKVTTWVVSFPVKSPKESVLRSQMPAMDQLDHYQKLQANWCEHNASCTVYVKDDEWFEVGNWVYKHWDLINGVSFIPYDGGKYEQAPYQEITKEEYNKTAKSFPKIDYSQLSKYEEEDNTQGSKTLACSGNKCDI